MVPEDCARLAELLGCGLLQGSYIPPPELKEVRDLTRYRTRTVQARTSGIQRLARALESAGIKPGPAAVMADLARGRARTSGPPRPASSPPG